MPARIQQAAIVVLAMNFDQICANFPEQRSRAGRIVDKGPTASINPQCTADDQRFARFDVDAIFGQNGPERVPGTRLKESGGYARSFLTLPHQAAVGPRPKGKPKGRSEEHTSELQSLMRISYAGFCLKKKKHTTNK